MEFLHPAMWHVALESWQWIHQVAAPCNVIRGSRMTCHWIRPVAEPCNVAGGSGMTCHGIRPNVRHIGIRTSGFDFDHITTVDMSFCTSLRNFIQIGPPSAEKMTSCRFSRWWISAIFDFMDTMMSSLSSAPGMLVHFKLKSMHPMIRNLISVTSVHCADIIFRLSGSFRVH